MLAMIWWESVSERNAAQPDAVQWSRAANTYAIRP
jgi:hypothetical protein